MSQVFNNAAFIRHSLASSFATSMHSLAMAELKERLNADQKAKGLADKDIISFILSEHLPTSLDLMADFYAKALAYYEKMSDAEIIDLISDQQQAE